MSQQINLLNLELFKQSKPFSALIMARILGAMVLGVVLLTGYARYQLSNLDKQATLSAAQLLSAQSELAKVNAEFGVRQKSTMLANEIQNAETEVRSIQKVFDILKKGEFGNTAGYSTYMRAFSRQSVSGLWLTGFNINGAGNEIGIMGKATRPELVPAYINKLKQEPVLLGKSFSALEMQVPKVDVVSKAAAPADKHQELAGYVDFNLQSSGMKTQIDAPGAPVK